MVIKISIEQAKKDLIKIFELNKNNKSASYQNENKFFIDKREFERFQVIEKLKNYFSDKVLVEGYLQVGQITFVFTDFEFKSGKPNFN